MLPTEEEKNRIIEAQMANSDIPLGNAEQFLLTLASVVELEARLKLWLFKLDFENVELVCSHVRCDAVGSQRFALGNRRTIDGSQEWHETSEGQCHLSTRTGSSTRRWKLFEWSRGKRWRGRLREGNAHIEFPPVRILVRGLSIGLLGESARSQGHHPEAFSPVSRVQYRRGATPGHHRSVLRDG